MKHFINLCSSLNNLVDSLNQSKTKRHTSHNKAPNALNPWFIHLKLDRALQWRDLNHSILFIENPFYLFYTMNYDWTDSRNPTKTKHESINLLKKLYKVLLKTWKLAKKGGIKRIETCPIRLNQPLTMNQKKKIYEEQNGHIWSLDAKCHLETPSIIVAKPISSLLNWKPNQISSFQQQNHKISLQMMWKNTKKKT